MSIRRVTMSITRVTMSLRGVTMSLRGVTMSIRGVTMSIRGVNMSIKWQSDLPSVKQLTPKSLLYNQDLILVQLVQKLEKCHCL